MKPFLVFIFILLAKQSFCQSKTETFITAEEAAKLASKHSYHSNDNSSSQEPWGIGQTKLDTANRCWKVTTSKVTYHTRGKTSKARNSDRQLRCKDINGCHTIYTRVVWVNAVNGKIKKIENEKLVAGNFE